MLLKILFFNLGSRYSITLGLIFILIAQVAVPNDNSYPVISKENKTQAFHLIEKVGFLIDIHHKLRPWETKDTPKEKEALTNALAACQKVIDAYPGTEYEADMRYSMAMLYSERRDYNKKNEILNALIKDFPSTKHAYNAIFAKACDYQQVEDYANAIDWYTKIPDDNEHHFTSQLQITHCLFKQGKDNEAFDSLLKLLSTYQKNEKFIMLRFKSEDMLIVPVLLENGKTIYALLKTYSYRERSVPVGKENEILDVPVNLIVKERKRQKKDEMEICRFSYLKTLLDNKIVCGTKYIYGNQKNIDPQLNPEFICAQRQTNSWDKINKPDKRISLLFGALACLTPEQCDAIFNCRKNPEKGVIGVTPIFLYY